MIKNMFVLFALSLLSEALPPRIELAPPFLAKAGNQPISVTMGHSAPVFADWDGDGLPDLLVGQFAEGRLRIYKNKGTRGEPRFEDFIWFEAGGKIASVDYG
jgi:hypothetical protein